MTRSALALVLLLVATAGCGRPAKAPVESWIGRLPADRFYIERDLFLPADEPAVTPAGEATFLREDDEVFGIIVRDRARAYPTTMLSYHHVVNDVLEGIPVAVTY